MAKRRKMARAGSRLIRWTSRSLFIALGAVLVTLAVYHHPTGCPATVVDHRTTNKSHNVAPVSSPAMPPPPPLPSPPPPPPPPPPPSPACDLFSGHWVFDNLSYPLYKDRECRFMYDDLACEKYGRKDLSYQHWRWQPHGCDLPRFNAKALLERLRGKRLVFVGDSINRNQWVSMICLLESSIPRPFKYRKSNSSLYTFKATEYNMSIDFYWSPLLVESNADNPSNHSFWDQIVRIKSIKKHARHWGDADILVFNSYLWWRTPKLKLLKGSFESPNKAYKAVDAFRCYKMALKTLSNWLDINVNRSKVQLFYVSMSATHHQAEQWGMQRHQTCLNETNPISIQGFRGKHGSDPRMMRAVEAMVSKLQEKGLKMQMLNITQLSEYRKDGHPSIYRKLWRPLTKKQLSDPRNYADCTHWCLPGVPDVWNELLQSYILQN